MKIARFKRFAFAVLAAGSFAALAGCDVTNPGTARSLYSDGPTCAAAADCPAPADACLQAVCAFGACGVANVAKGTPIAGDAGACRQLVCDGNGASMAVPADLPPVPRNAARNPCVTTSCSDGSLVMTTVAAGAACGIGVCDGAGQCAGCLTDADCAKPDVCGPERTCVDPRCNDGKRDGAETDVDCGGPSCGATCATGKACATGADCRDGVCDPATKTCAPATCADGVKNGGESDVDCGGPSCKPCGPEQACTVAADCAGNVCDPIAKTCTADCFDGVKNDNETDVDCGGRCGANCLVGKTCATGADCASGSCDAESKTCVSSQCIDHQQDGAETDVDCGGGTCAACDLDKKCAVDADCTSGACDSITKICVADACADDHLDGTETDVDCGGASCARCDLGKACVVDGDCASKSCDSATQTCVADACSDHHQDGAETDVDCGGGTCAACDLGKSCSSDRDCASGHCDDANFVCVADACADHKSDGAETDVDCGGETCAPCLVGKTCLVDGDCASGACDAESLTCVDDACADHQKDGKETDVDCGGGICGTCDLSMGCLVDADCTSGSCDAISLTCVSNACFDHQKDAWETDVDCGGNACAPCADGKACLIGSDCASNQCSEGVCAPPASTGSYHGFCGCADDTEPEVCTVATCDGDWSDLLAKCTAKCSGHGGVTQGYGLMCQPDASFCP